jgi:two-component system, OmpR family, response regulator PhoP
MLRNRAAEGTNMPMNSPAEESARVGLVEDDADLRDSIEAYLSANGFSVWSAESAEAFYKQMLIAPIDVAVVDIGLPGESGLAVTQHLRGMQNIDVIILSGHSALEDRLRGLAEGANRYLVKPVDLRELVANISACMAKKSPPPVKSQTPSEWLLVKMDWVLYAPCGTAVQLTSREWEFMCCLTAGETQSVSRRDIATALHGGRLESFDYHRIDTLVSRLRQKIFAATGQSAPIRTLQSKGFAFSAPCRMR